MLTRWTTPFR